MAGLKTRLRTLKDESSINDSDTVSIDINIHKPISAFEVLYEATNGATSCVDHELHDDISKIELVDGSNVITSLSMMEAQALEFFCTKKKPFMQLSEAASGTQKESALILFGRYLGDPDYYLDPTKFDNLQLQLVHNLTISATAGFATGTGKVSVFAHILEDGFGPVRGYMMSKEKKSWTTSSSGDEITKLPVDHPYKLLLIKALVSLSRFDEVITQVKLGVDEDSFIPFDLRGRHLAYFNEQWFGQLEQTKTILSADDGTVLMDLFDIKHANALCTADDHIATVESLDAEQVSLGLYDMTTPGTPALQSTAKGGVLQVRGGMLHSCLAYPFGNPNDPDTYLDVRDYGSVELTCTQGTASAAAAIVLQQLRAYVG